MMQQIYLTGECADDAAAKALASLRINTAGYRLLPLRVAGCERGQVLRLLTVPDAPYFNDVPCAVQIAPGEKLMIREAFGKIAAPALRQAVCADVPVFMDGISRGALRSRAFYEAVKDCVNSRCQVFAVVEEDAVGLVRAMTGEDDQLWLTVTRENKDDRLRQLLQELSMRL